MADSNDEPDWSLLPHDPARFFGLGSQFDRRDLKRSYNQLLRRYKPERFPQEFQRIRAAYEQLEEAIRYGHSTDAISSPAESIEWLAHSSADSPTRATSTSREPAAPVVPLHERIKTGSVSGLYRELQDRPDKSPYEYYALAVMSDVVDRQTGRQFAEWILKGLAAYPGEIGLTSLLHAYFRSPIELEHCRVLLLACSKIVPEGYFFPLTEPLWRALLRGPEFRHFRETLRACEANLKGIHIDNRLAFTLQILKPAVWVADREWIDEAFAFIEDNYERVPAYLEYDLEILARLREYIRFREVYAGGTAMQQQLDKALRDYFSEEQIVGDRSVIDCQVSIAKDREGLTAAFANYGNAAYSPFFALWNWVSYDVAERHVEPPKEAPDENIWLSRTKALVAQIKTQTDNSRLGVTWAVLTWVYGIGCVLCFLSPILLPIFIGLVLTLDRSAVSGGFEVFGTIASVVLGGVAGFYLTRAFDRHVWKPYCIRVAGRCYRQMWQREITNFLARSNLDYHTFIAFLNQFATSESKASWAKYYVDQDYALPMFAIAHRFVV